MRSSKSRSRSKSNRNRPNGVNVVNRVFDSSGPEGKVRGTPQQIIDKYNQLARDAQLGNDRVATENFQQHAEHYLRMLNEAQREIDARREEQERQNRERQAERDRERQERQERQDRQAAAGSGEQPDVVAEAREGSVSQAPAPSGETELVETPEGEPVAKKPVQRKPRGRRPAKPADNVDAGGDAPVADGQAEAPAPKPRRSRAKPKVDKSQDAKVEAPKAESAEKPTESPKPDTPKSEGTSEAAE